MEIIPHAKWREGVFASRYRISGEAEINGEVWPVNVSIPAVVDGKIRGLGKLGEDRFVTALVPQNNERISAAAILVDGEGQIVFTEDGKPAYAEQNEHNAAGTFYFCPHNRRLTLRIEDAVVRNTGRTAEGSDVPFLDLAPAKFEIVPAVGCRAVDDGEDLPLTQGKQAARKTKAAAPAEVVM